MEMPVFECVVCMDDFADQVWWTSGHEDRIRTDYCIECAKELISCHYKIWHQQISEADCSAALRRLIKAGPPVTFADAARLEGVPSGTRGVLMWGQREIEGSLEGAPDNEGREKLWQTLKEGAAAMEIAEATQETE